MNNRDRKIPAQARVIRFDHSTISVPEPATSRPHKTARIIDLSVNRAIEQRVFRRYSFDDNGGGYLGL